MNQDETIAAVQDAAQQGASRRSLMRSIGVGAASVAAVSSLAAGGLASSSTPAEAQSVTDAAILNFALNLEYLEAEFYLRAATGAGLPASALTGLGTQGTVTGGSLVPFQIPLIQQYASNLAADEQAHVLFLRAALGSAAYAEPTINLSTSFTNLAVAAGLISAGQTFNPFADEISFLLAAFIFEDVGVTAYGGALSSITTPAYITAAGAIQTVEGYHAATIRTLLASIGAGVAVAKISALRGTLSGASPTDDQGIIMPNGAVNIVPADSNALIFRRTPRQVLNIVYFAQNATSGGFYPNGMNGTITS